MNTLFHFTYALLIYCLCFITPVGAVITEADLDTLGDGLITRDLDNGIDWLDVPLTLNRSVNDVLNGIGGRDFISEGFRYASNQDFINLFNSAGLGSVIDGFFTDPTLFALAENLHNLLGLTRDAPEGIFATEGYGGINEFVVGNAWIPAIVLNECSDFSGNVCPGDAFIVTPEFAADTTLDNRDALLGSYLIRESQDPPPIPIPAAFWLLGSALTGLFFSANRK